MSKKQIIFLISGCVCALLIALIIVNMAFTGTKKITIKNKIQTTDEVDTSKTEYLNSKNQAEREYLAKQAESQLNGEILINKPVQEGFSKIEDITEEYKDGVVSNYPSIRGNNDSEIYISDLSDSVKLDSPNSNREITNYNNDENYVSEKIDEKELKFLSELLVKADNWTEGYQECLSYVFEGNNTELEKYTKNELSALIDDFNSLDTVNNTKFEEIKKSYLSGMNNIKTGFLVYLKQTKEGEANQYFMNSDHDFYDAQQKLATYLKKYELMR